MIIFNRKRKDQGIDRGGSQNGWMWCFFIPWWNSCVSAPFLGFLSPWERLLQTQLAPCLPLDQAVLAGQPGLYAIDRDVSLYPRQAYQLHWEACLGGHLTSEK